MSGQDNPCVTSFRLVPATTDDVPALVRVHTAAFRSDLFSNLMLLRRPDDAHQVLMQKSIESWLADPAVQIIKAVRTDGQIVGWACWLVKGGDLDPERAGQPATNHSSPASAQEVGKVQPQGAEMNLSEIHASQQQRSAQDDPTRSLGKLMREEMLRWEEKHLSGRKHMVLQALATDPGLQGRGIGSHLVQWVTDIADAQGLLCWAHASPASRSLYSRAGFEELGKSDFNLAEYAPGGKEGNRGWGLYTFSYMLRSAKNSDQA